MPDPRALEPSAPFPIAVPATLIVLLGSMVAWWFQSPPLTTRRPPGATGTGQVIGDQSVEARLWQDPLRATLELDKDNGVPQEPAREAGGLVDRVRAAVGFAAAAPAPVDNDPASIGNTVGKQIADRLTRGRRVLVMPVMIDNSPYAENQEWRLRTRYAVLSALSTAGYVPEDDRHIGLTRVPWETTSELRARLDLPPTAPERAVGHGSARARLAFEWFAGDPARAVPTLEMDDRDGAGGGALRKPESVLLLWMDDGLFADHAATRMAGFLLGLDAAVLKQAGNRPLDTSGRAANDRFPCEVAILGPDSSTTLRSMLMDPIWLRGTRSQATEGTLERGYADRLRPITWYASHATAPAELLLRTESNASTQSSATVWTVGRDRRIRWTDAEADQGPLVYRTHCADDLLARELVAELARRGVHIEPQSQDRVVLFSESDTLYGRSLPLVFRAAALEARDRKPDRERAPERERGSEREPMPWADPVDGKYFRRILAATPSIAGNPVPGRSRDDGIDAYTYLRGLDGVTGRDAADAAGSSAGKSSGGLKVGEVQIDPVGAAERPDGNRQLDYVRRIAAELAARDAGTGGRVAAIGVLGSDVYDKLLLIRALRGKFPDAVFFTTDLDNRLLHPEELPYTRNLIVASGFGLQVSDRIQGAVPPFRDSYQTAMYVSTLRATGRIRRLNRGQPRLFEVARSGAYDLTPVGPDAKAAFGEATLGNAPEPLHRPRPVKTSPGGLLKQFWWAALVLGASLVVLLSPLTARVRARLRGKRPSGVARPPDNDQCGGTGLPPEGGGSKTAISPAQADGHLIECARAETSLLLKGAWAFVLGVGLIFACYFSDTTGEGEPLELIEGISIWPTEFVQLSVIFFAFMFIVRGYSTLRRNAINIARRFELPYDSPALPPVGWRTWRYPPGVGESTRTSDPPREDVDDPGGTRRHRAWRQWLNFALTRTVGTWTKLAARKVVECAGDDERRRFHRVKVRQLWAEYRWLSDGLMVQVLRGGVVAAAFCTAAGTLMWVYGLPNRPSRDWVSDTVHLVLTVGAFGAMAVLTFYVVDAVRLCNAFCSQLGGGHTPWEPGLNARIAEARGLRPEDVDDLLDVRLIAWRTEAVGGIIFYPFLLMILMVFARSDVFDRWHWPAPMALIYVALLAYAAWAVRALRRSAIEARRDAIARLNDRLIEAKASVYRDIPSDGFAPLALSLRAANDRGITDAGRLGNGDESQGGGGVAGIAVGVGIATAVEQLAPAAQVVVADETATRRRVEQLQLVIDEVHNTRQGAFRPLAQHPVFQAIFVVLGGTSAVKLIEFLILLQ